MKSWIHEHSSMENKCGHLSPFYERCTIYCKDKKRGRTGLDFVLFEFDKI